MSIGTQIAKYRKALGLTQQQLADRLSPYVIVSVQAVSHWELEDNSPDIDSIPVIAKVLGCSINDLYDGAGFEANFSARDRYFNEEHMYTFLKTALYARGLTGALKALPEARRLHEGQFRKRLFTEDVPYINHPLTLACNALALGLNDDDLIAALLLHDTVEDTKATFETLPANNEVKELVRLVTKEEGYDKGEYYKRISENPKACLIKLLDRVNNLSEMGLGFTKEKICEYVFETEHYIVPMLSKLPPEWTDAAWLIKYQMLSLIEAYKGGLM